MEEEKEYNSKWEAFDEAPGGEVNRIKVDGGYLYNVMVRHTKCTNTVFVPDIDLQRYQGHLRDAYKKGYDDGQLDARNGVDMEEMANPR